MMIEPNPTMGGAPVRVDPPMSDIPFQVHYLLPPSGLPLVMFTSGILEYVAGQKHQGAEW